MIDDNKPMTLREIRDRANELLAILKVDTPVHDYDDTDFAIKDLYYDREDDRVYARFSGM